MQKLTAQKTAQDLIHDLPSSVFGECPFSSGSVARQIVLVDRNVNGDNPCQGPKVGSRLASFNQGLAAVAQTVIPGVDMFQGQHDHRHVVVSAILQARVGEALGQLLPLPVHHAHVGEVEAAVASARAVLISAMIGEEVSAASVV